MNKFEIERFKGFAVVIILNSGQLMEVGIEDVNDIDTICISKKHLQDAYDGKATVEEVTTNENNLFSIKNSDIKSIRP